MASRVSGANGDGIEIFKTDSLGQTGGCIDYVPPVTVTDVLDTVISVPVIDSVLNITTSPVTITFTNVGNVYDFCPTGLQEHENTTMPILSPNPATNYITLSCQQPMFTTCKIQVYDIMGKQVFNQTTFIQKQFSIPVSSLPKGVYVVQVFHEGKKEYSKFIKQ
jgi:hypothetical protein